MGATTRAGTAYPSGAPELTPGFFVGSCYSIFSFMCMFYRPLFVLLYYFFWSLCCLFFFHLRILTTSLVSPNSSCVNVTGVPCKLRHRKTINYKSQSGYMVVFEYFLLRKKIISKETKRTVFNVCMYHDPVWIH